MMQITKKYESGRSMVEMIGYMAVIITVTASIGQLVYKAFGEYKFSKASMQVTELANAITKAGAIEANYGRIVDMINGESSVAADNEEGVRMIPSSFKVRGHSIYHAFGGTVTVGTPSAGSADTSAKFSITFHDLNYKQCVDLALKDWSKNKYVDLDSIFIFKKNEETADGAGATAAWYWPIYGSPYGTFALPVKMVDVAGTDDTPGQCQDNDLNSIMWVFN